MLNAITYGHFDGLGHMDFPKRYYGELRYDIKVIKKIFGIMIDKNIVLEINTSTLRKGHEQSMPDVDLLSIYKDCGGRFVTIGSDAHLVNDLAADFQYASNLASKYGFTKVYYEKHKAILIK